MFLNGIGSRKYKSNCFEISKQNLEELKYLGDDRIFRQWRHDVVDR